MINLIYAFLTRSGSTGHMCSGGGDSSALSGQTLKMCSGIIFVSESRGLRSNLGTDWTRQLVARMLRKIHAEME